ncbi:hypothetical protein ACKUB1_11860 [Methanospirillum stamsii]|nr:hypothetical protein [Methanospirillum stamsii]
MERFEARYHEEELVDLQAFYLANEDLFIKSFMWEYRDKLDLLARTCQDLVEGKIVSKVTYTPKRWDILPPELKE